MSRQQRVQQDFPPQIAEKDDLKIKKFTRERLKLGYFLLQIKTVFRFRSQKYLNPQVKILFASIHLKGPIYEWFKPTLKDYIELKIREEETDLIFGSWIQFEIAFK